MKKGSPTTIDRRSGAAASRPGAWPTAVLLGLTLAALVVTALLAGTARVARASGGSGPSHPPFLQGPGSHQRGDPLNVLFVFYAKDGARTFLVQYRTACFPGTGVAVFDINPPPLTLQGQGGAGNKRPGWPPDGSLDSVPITGWKDSSGLVRDISAKTGAPVHQLVEVRGGYWPSCGTVRGLSASPLLELASAYPGCLTAALPPAQGTSVNLLERCVRTDPALSVRRVLDLLGRIESAREQADLQVIRFDGSESVPSLESKMYGDGSTSRVLRLITEASLAGAGESEKRPEDVTGKNYVLVFDPDNMRGELPQALPAQVVGRGNPALKRVALTIDDGWYADMRILDLLKKWKIRYTAFLVGGRGVAEDHPDFVRKLYESGAEVCSHTYTHRVMRGLTETAFLDEIWRSEQAICRVTHELYPYVRYSGGAYDIPAVNWASQEGFWVIDWTIDSDDTTRGLTTEARAKSILGQLRPGAILLFHFSGYGSYDLLARVIPEIQRRGYEVTSLSRVLEGTPFRLQD